MRYEEWDWPPTRRRKFYRTIDLYQPSGWNSPITRKIVDVYWRTVVAIIKMLLAAALTIALIASIWLLWVIIGLVV
jgi:hypothetical protein